MQYAEMYILGFEGKLVGYRIYAVINDVEYYYDIQTRDTRFTSWCVSKIKLVRYQGYLVSDDELQGKYKVTQLTDQEKFKDLLNSVMHYKQMRDEYATI